MTEPVLGWRIWRLGSGRLESWAVNYRWEPGANRARCLARHRRVCDASPGQDCQCGFWAVWSPRLCVARAESVDEPPWHVMGLITGWGAVTVHGREGFRAERAAIRCLFTDWPGNSSTSPVAPSWPMRWWRRRIGRTAELGPGDAAIRDPRRWDALQATAARYAVPLVSLHGATELGLLGEFGVPPAGIEEARSLRIGSSSGS